MTSSSSRAILPCQSSPASSLLLSGLLTLLIAGIPSLVILLLGGA